MHPEIVEEKLKILPESPGCYIMKNDQNVIIYVGKAKVLKNRVRSYFIGAHNGKTQRMIEDIADFELIVTKTEAEALILENQLIKAHQPRYNILLKDDKTYPYIAITKEAHPRLILTRTPGRKYLKIFGPYTSAYEARETLEILNYLYPFRKCITMPKKLCLYYHIGKCLGPCVFDIDPVVYEPYIAEISHFLKGNPQKIRNMLTEKMLFAAEHLEFEQAGTYKKMIETVNNLFEKKGTHPTITAATDIIGFAYNDDYLSVQVFHVRDGSVVERESDIFVYEDNVTDIIESYIYQFYQSKNVLLPKQIFLSKELDTTALKEAYPTVAFLTPQRGEKRHLLDFAMKNAEEMLTQKALIAENKYQNTLGAVEALGKMLQMPTPYRIEMIDTANLRNQDIVSGLITFINGQPSKKDYRKFNIKTTTEQDDYQALREVVYRRLYRNLMEDLAMPNLLVVDGGIGHVHVAQEVMQSLNVNIPLIGLAKNSRHRTEAIVLTDGTTIKLKTTSPVFKLLGKMQEEVHRFVIDFHRKKRMQSAFSSELTDIPGIGEATRKKLLSHFPHVEMIKNATVDELEKIVNRTQAKKIYQYFQNKILLEQTEGEI